MQSVAARRTQPRAKLRAARRTAFRSARHSDHPMAHLTPATQLDTDQRKHHTHPLAELARSFHWMRCVLALEISFAHANSDAKRARLRRRSLRKKNNVSIVCRPIARTDCATRRSALCAKKLFEKKKLICQWRRKLNSSIDQKTKYV